MSNKASDAMCAPEKHTPWCPLLEENVKLKARIAELEAALPVIGHRGYLAGFGKAIEMAAELVGSGYVENVVATIKALKPPHQEQSHGLQEEKR